MSVGAARAGTPTPSAGSTGSHMSGLNHSVDLSRHEPHDWHSGHLRIGGDDSASDGSPPPWILPPAVAVAAAAAAGSAPPPVMSSSSSSTTSSSSSSSRAGSDEDLLEVVTVAAVSEADRDSGSHYSLCKMKTVSVSTLLMPSPCFVTMLLLCPPILGFVLFLFVQYFVPVLVQILIEM